MSPDWTKKSFNRLRDVSPKDEPMQRRMARDALGTRELATWDVLRVGPPVVRSFAAGPDGLDLLCIGGKRPKGGDTERFPDFWDD